MSLVTQTQVFQAEEAYMKAKREFDAQNLPIEPREIRIKLEQFGLELTDLSDRILRIERILWEISTDACQKYGLQIIPF